MRQTGNSKNHKRWESVFL